MRNCLCVFVLFLNCIGSVQGAERLSQRIDAIVSAAQDGPTAPRSSDAEFLRRVSLDLAGVIPAVAEVRAFLDDKSPEKRRLLIERLLAGTDFPRRMQQAFSVMLLERRADSTILVEEWEAYLQSSFEKNKPLDQLVRELLTADGTDAATRPAMKFLLARGATDHKLIARDVGRLLLGRNLECAQCHDHPAIKDYKQAEFFGLVAFLDRSYLYRDKKTNESFFIEKGAAPKIEFTSVFTSQTQNAKPHLLNGTVVEIPEFEKGQELKEPTKDGVLPIPKFALRPLLAEHLTSPQNRAFSRNMANRLWAMMMGRGLVHPLDMSHSGNPPSHPELLEMLADELVAAKFDVKHLLRQLALSETYQRSSQIGDQNEITPHSYAAFNMKPLSAEQIAFSLMRATGSEQRVTNTPADKSATTKYRPDKGHPIPAENIDNVLKLFRSVYAAQPGQAEDDFVPSVAAALFAENDGLLLRWLTRAEGNLIDRLSKLQETDAVVDELYLAVLTRQPTDEERGAVANYLKDAHEECATLLRELAWALLASSEFRFNHWRLECRSMTNLPDCRSPEHELSRRQMLYGLAGTAGALSLGGILQTTLAEEIRKQQKQVLLIFNDGGMSQFESWDPKPDSEFGGPFRAISTSVAGTKVSELLPHTATQMHHLALVRGLNTHNPSHGSRMFAFNGKPKNRGVPYPDLGPAVASFLHSDDSTLPPCVLVKPYSGGFDYKAAGFLGAKYGELLLGEGKPPVHMLRPDSLTDAASERRSTFRKFANGRFAKGRRSAETNAYAHSFNMAEQLMKRGDLFDESKVSPQDAERYGTHKHGRHMLLGRRLLEAGVTFVEVRSYHWDTHSSNFDLHYTMVSGFDQPFAALIEDLAESGRLEHTLVIVLSEFGRTPKVNVGLGRDHWPQAWSMCMAGCGIKGGTVHGKTNPRGTWVDDGQVGYADLFHTYFRALGFDTEKTEYNNGGQPLPVADEDAAAIGTILA